MRPEDKARRLAKLTMATPVVTVHKTITGRHYHDKGQLNIFEKEKPPCSPSAK